MELQYCRARKVEELQQILGLQKRNLAQNLSDNELQKEGFVTVLHSLELLKKMNTICPHIIAKDGKKVIGYALCMPPTFANEIKVLKPMFHEINKGHFKNRNYLVMGQICIDKAYRGKGIFRELYKTMLKSVQHEFSTIITEVNSTNTRSLQAHYAVGFKDFKTYSSGGQDWHLMVLE